jgi:hypothetical protein
MATQLSRPAAVAGRDENVDGACLSGGTQRLRQPVWRFPIHLTCSAPASDYFAPPFRRRQIERHQHAAIECMAKPTAAPAAPTLVSVMSAL